MFYMELAGLPIAIKNKYYYTEDLCNPHKVMPRDVVMTLEATEEEIEHELAVSQYLDITHKSFYEFLVIFRKLCLGMLTYDALMLHAATIEIDNKAFAFSALSGTGKTTHTLLWKQVFGGRVRYVNGDKPILRFIDDELYACGSPWRGKEGYGENIMIPLKGIIFIERSEKNSIRPMTTKEILPKLIHQVVVPEDNEQLTVAFLDLLDRILNKVPCYCLKCNMEPEAALVAYKELIGE